MAGGHDFLVPARTFDHDVLFPLSRFVGVECKGFVQGTRGLGARVLFFFSSFFIVVGVIFITIIIIICPFSRKSCRVIAICGSGVRDERGGEQGCGRIEAGN